MSTDWASWHKHVTRVVEQQGQWWGLGDGDGAPLLSLPVPLSSDTPEQWMSAEDIEVQFAAIDSSGGVNRLTQLLIMDGLTGFDVSGQLKPAEKDYTLLTAWRGSDGSIVRRGGLITHTDCEDTDNDGTPSVTTVHALNLMDAWNTVPAVSWPVAWWKATPYPRREDEAGLPYGRPWDMARVELATRATFRWKTGKAGFVIRRLAQESLDAVMFTQRDPGGSRWVDDPYHVVEVPEIDTSSEISLQAADEMLWDTVVAQAKNAGLVLGARLWWPGDPPVRCWSPVNSSMKPEQVDISPSQGPSQRILGYRSFPHAMVVLTVKEVG